MADNILTFETMPKGKEVNSSGYATYMLTYSKSVTGRTLTDLQSIWKPEVSRDGIYFAESVSVCTDRNTGAPSPCKLPANYKDQEFITVNTKTNKFYWAKNYADATAGKWVEISGKAKEVGFLASPTALDKAFNQQQLEKQEGVKLPTDDDKGKVDKYSLKQGEDEERVRSWKPKWLPDFDIGLKPWFDINHKNFWWLAGIIALIAYWKNRKVRRTARKTARKVTRRLAA